MSDYKDEIEDIRHDDGFPYEETGEWHQVPRIDGTPTHNRIYRSIILKGGDWVGLDFSGFQLDYTTLSLARIAGSTFKGADFKASFNHCVVIGSDFSATHFRRNDSQHTVFERCNFTQANTGKTIPSTAALLSNACLPRSSWFPGPSFHGACSAHVRWTLLSSNDSAASRMSCSDKAA